MGSESQREKKMNSELKKVVEGVKAAQVQLQSLLKDKSWIEDARKYAARQGKEVKKLLRADVSKVRTFIERERKELERFQKQIPGEVKKLKKFVDLQKKELEKLLGKVRQVQPKGAKGTKGKAKKATARKRTARKSTPASSG